MGETREVVPLGPGEACNVNPLSESRQRVSRECSHSRLNGERQQLMYVVIASCCVYLSRSMSYHLLFKKKKVVLAQPVWLSS